MWQLQQTPLKESEYARSWITLVLATTTRRRSTVSGKISCSEMVFNILSSYGFGIRPTWDENVKSKGEHRLYISRP